MARDRRMNLVNELFQNVRFLKYYGWGTHQLYVTARRSGSFVTFQNIAGLLVSETPAKQS